MIMERVQDDLFGHLDKMIDEFKASSSSPESKASSLELKTATLSFRDLKRAIGRAERCGHGSQQLRVLDTETVFFLCRACHIKTFVDCSADILEAGPSAGAEEISLDTEEEGRGGERLLQESRELEIVSVESVRAEKEAKIAKEDVIKGGSGGFWPRGSRCRVMFTGYKCRAHMRAVVALGGGLSSRAAASDVLVTDSLRVTPRLLAALGRGLPVVSPAWVLASRGQGGLLDPWRWLLVDQYREQLHSLALGPSLLASRREGGSLRGQRVLLSPENRKHLQELESIIESHGGVIAAGDQNGNVDVAIVEDDEVDSQIFKTEKMKVINRKNFYYSLLRNKGSK